MFDFTRKNQAPQKVAQIIGQIVKKSKALSGAGLGLLGGAGAGALVGLSRPRRTQLGSFPGLATYVWGGKLVFKVEPRISFLITRRAEVHGLARG
jgi:phage tail tape-measure protein